MTTPPAVRGFTLVEMLVTTVLLGLVLVGLHGVHLQQRKFTDWQQQLSADHDAFRIIGSVLSAELREAVVNDGDVLLPGEDSLVVRSPLGFALVCATRSNPAVVGLSHTMGQLPTETGDSLLVYTEGGWRALAVQGEDRPGQRGLACAHGTRTPAAQYRLVSGAADSIPVGAPVRTFQRHSYHLTREDGQRWLARTDPSGTEILAGPLAPRGLRFRFLDAAGAGTTDPGAAVGVELEVVLTPPPGSRTAVPDTFTMVFQGRNR